MLEQALKDLKLEENAVMLHKEYDDRIVFVTNSGKKFEWLKSAYIEPEPVKIPESEKKTELKKSSKKSK